MVIKKKNNPHIKNCALCFFLIFPLIHSKFSKRYSVSRQIIAFTNKARSFSEFFYSAPSTLNLACTIQLLEYHLRKGTKNYFQRDGLKNIY